MSTSTTGFRGALLTAGLLGVTGVSLGAFGAHALAAGLAERGMTQAWETASRYHLIHTVAVFGAAVFLRFGASRASRCVRWAARCWTAGTVIFSGSLYLLALGGPRWLGPITPLGGIALIVGWGALVAAARASDE